MKLPGWAKDNVTSVRDEAAEFRAATPEERLRALRAACMTAARLRALHASPTAALDWSDPLPPDSVRLLARLRATARKRP